MGNAFDTIVTAIQQGCTIFENIRKLDGWMLIIGFSLLPLIIGQALKAVYRAVKSREKLQKTITDPAS